MLKITRTALFALLLLVTGVAFAQQPTISSTLNNRPNVYTDTLQNFTVTTVANSEAGHMVKVLMALANPAQAADISLEYYETANSSWMPLTYDSNGEILWGPSTGFPLMDATSQFRIIASAPATYNYSLTIVDASTNAVVGSPANESVVVTNYVAPVISSDLNNRPNVVTGTQEAFGVTTTANSEAGHMVKVLMALANPAQAADISLEYYETANSSWMPLTFDSNGEILWGPSTGFPLMNATSQFRITFSATGTYNYGLTIVDAATNAPVGSTVNESVTVNAPYVAPVISSDLNNRPNVVTGTQETFGVTTTANSEAGHMVKVLMALANPAQAADISLEYYETANSSWMPLTFDSNGEILWGPSTGFPLMDATSQFRITFSATGTYNYGLTIVDAATNAPVGSTVNESVTVNAPYVAPVISSDLNNRPNVVTGTQETFGVTTTANSEAGHMVKVLMALANPAQAADISLEYYETANSSWMPLTFDSNGEILWGPSTGFPLMDATSQFRITFSATGTYNYGLTIVDAATNAPVGSTVNESVTVNAPYVAPVISSDLDNRPNVLVNVQEQFTVTTVANSESGHMVKVLISLVNPAQAANISLEYYETANSSWMPLTFDSNGEILWGPSTGFPLMNATSQFRITFTANGTYDYSLSMVDATSGAIVGSAANESVFVDVDTYINTVNGMDVKIYPNPASSVIKVEGAEISNANIIVYDVLGKAVASVTNASFDAAIDVTGLDKGVYFVRIENNGTVITKKINVIK